VASLRGLFRGSLQAGVNAQIDLRSFHLFLHMWQTSVKSL
jgi:hypothetical protein